MREILIPHPTRARSKHVIHHHSCHQRGSRETGLWPNSIAGCSDGDTTCPICPDSALTTDRFVVHHRSLSLDPLPTLLHRTRCYAHDVHKVSWVSSDSLFSYTSGTTPVVLQSSVSIPRHCLEPSKYRTLVYDIRKWEFICPICWD